MEYINKYFKRILAFTPEVFWTLLGQIGLAIGGLGGLKLLTSVLSPSEFGKLSLANTIIALISANFFVPLGNGLVRFWSIAKAKGELEDFYIISNRIAKRISIYLIFIIAIVATIFNFINKPSFISLLMFSSLIGIVIGYFSFRMCIFTARRQRMLVSLLNITYVFFSPVVAWVLVFLIAKEAYVALFGYFIAAAFLLILSKIFYTRAIKETLPQGFNPKKSISLGSDLSRQILSYSWPFLLWGIFGWLHTSYDKWAIQVFYGSESVGAYAVVSQLAFYPLNFCSGFLMTLFIPVVFQKVGNPAHNHLFVSAKKIIWIMSSFYILCTIALIGFFTLYHSSLILFISNSSFVRFSDMLPGLTLGWALFFLGQLLTSFGLLVNKSQLYILPKLLSATAAVSISFYLLPKIGPRGIIWGLVSSGILYSGLCFFLAIRFTGPNNMKTNAFLQE